MCLYVSIIGIDGSGKSTVTPALADLVAAELGVTVATVGDDLRCKTPEEDLLLPGFAPDGEMLAARLARWLRKGARAATHHQELYPPLKLAQLAMQERTARQIDISYHPDVIFCDKNLLLSSAGRAINHMDSKADPLTCTLSIGAVHDYVVEGWPLSKVSRSIPCLKLMRWLRRFDERLKLGLMELPDALIFLSIAPEAALARLTARGKRVDGHENLNDLVRAQNMYRRVVEFFRRRRGERNTAIIDVTGRSVGQILRQAVGFCRQLPLRQRHREKEQGRLGTTSEGVSNVSAVVKKMLTYQYLIRYVLPNLLHQGSAYELTFPLSKLGRLFLREGYSANVMKAIYLQDGQEYGALDRIFLDYPLHRAIYYRLEILKQLVEREFRHRLRRFSLGDTVKVMTAPSGYSPDLFQPLERIARSGRGRVRAIHVLASDLDADGRIERELRQMAHRVGIDPSRGLGTGFEFVRGDLTLPETRERFERSGPYDMVVFVGHSCWISKPHLVSHLNLIHRHLLAPGGVLFTDCFTPQTFALSGKYVGYKANYYSRREFTSILAYCGFDPLDITWKSGPQAINHVCVARTRPST